METFPNCPTPFSSDHMWCRLVSILAIGEGHHNYHHTFPYDYGTSEWGLSLNLTTGFINTMAKLGQAYDLR